MRKSITYVLFLISVSSLFVLQSCKKGDKGGTEPTIQTNLPPASDYFLGMQFFGGSTYPTWTTDFEEYKILTDQFSPVNGIDINGDNIVLSTNPFTKNYEIAYGKLSDLGNLKTTRSEWRVDELAILNNGNIIVYATQGNSRYLGYMKTAEGEVDITYNLLPIGQSLNNFYNAGDVLIGDLNNSGGSNLAFVTSDGTKLNAHTKPLSDPVKYDNFDGKIWAFSENGWAFTTVKDTSIFSTTWQAGFLSRDSSNTTDTVGDFLVDRAKIIATGSEFRLYGQINANQSTGTHYPCVNISKDKGITWETKFLTGIPNDTPFGEFIYTAKGFTIIHIPDGSDDNVYASTNGVDFTKWTEASKITNFSAFSRKATYKR